MKKNIKLKLLSLLGVFVLISIFILLSYLVQMNFEFFERLVGNNSWGLVIYIFLNFIGIVIAPITVIPLIVVVTSIWGPVVASLASWFAWILGSVVAFWISKRFGVPIVKRFVSLDELYKFEERFSILNSFWGIVFLRMVIPVEILSYGLGLFSRVGFWKYAFASALGLLPVTFIFGYFGMIPFIYQVVLGLVILIGLVILMILREVWEKA
ncbi:MAG: VTT domain-containing protein [archaeon]